MILVKGSGFVTLVRSLFARSPFLSSNAKEVWKKREVVVEMKKKC